DDWSAGHHGGLRVEVQAPPGVTIELAAVDLVPCEVTALARHDDHYDHTGPALLADLLRPLAAGEEWYPAPLQWRAVWITLDVDSDAPAGSGEVTVQLVSARSGDQVGTCSLPFTVIAAELPPLPIVNTHWFHVDGLAHYYGVEPYSEVGWRLIENFLVAARRMDINSVLTPVHTPPLDTAEGTTRLNVQLAEVSVTETGYAFGFDKLLRWIEVCRRVGITHLEVAHLFTQWGARSCPAVYATDGSQLFGWEDAATGEAYTEFLTVYIPAVRAVLDQHWGPNVIWHLADEPDGEEARTQYGRLKEITDPLLAGTVVVDALSDHAFWAEGLVPIPVVATDAVQPFLASGVQPLWVYYCTGQSVDVANRFIGQPSYRNRVLGLQLFAFDCAGFLHWGFNFWNAGRSLYPIDPFADTTAGRQFQAGDPFIVYPGPDGTAWDSIRLRVFAEAMADVRALHLLADLIGRAGAIELINPDGALTFDAYPHDPVHYLRIRAAVNSAIAAQLVEGE
ncbi:MAG: DUF4091 domain-containing protein, partial [Propionibacteriales bacterium]|nr:DUF4091 domain-containing protein [Propionibacteriales bacterium]